MGATSSPEGPLQKVEPATSGEAEPSSPHSKSSEPAPPLQGRMNNFERATAALAAGSLLVAICSLLTSIVSCRNSVDTTQMAKAIGTLTGLAKDTKRQADALGGEVNALGAEDNIMGSEFFEMRTQTNDLGVEANAAQGQLAAAKTQTRAISDQTTAIKNSATAAVRSAGAQIASAEAQTRAANAAAAAQRPAIALTELTLTGVDNPVEKEGALKGEVKLSLNYQFTNTGGSPWEMVENEVVLTIVKSGFELPPNPDFSHSSHLRGEGLTVPRENFFHLIQPLEFGVSLDTAKLIKSGSAIPLIYGVVTYRVFGVDHRYCYADSLPFQNGAPVRFLQIGGPAYHCDT